MRPMTVRDPFGFASLDDELKRFVGDPFVRSPMELFNPINGEKELLPVDIFDGPNNEILVRASLPGFKKNEVDMSFENGILTIRAEHKEEEKSTKENYYRRERRMSSVHRRISLPGLVDENKARAELKDGILTLTIPRTQESKPKKLTIQ